jgi:hypothetical protein
MRLSFTHSKNFRSFRTFASFASKAFNTKYTYLGVFLANLKKIENQPETLIRNFVHKDQSRELWGSREPSGWGSGA